ncbi:MAG: cytochrome c biogenesis protein CcdA [Candidatus Kaelpia aquatica]|nr:cytochrome c biogenesis protein CcdA [Candidatus Kaelpia aquatica]
MNDISFIMAFLGGVFYFFSPCILPLIPSFLSFISGISFNEMKENPACLRKRMVIYTLLFLLGFSCIFISLGLGASLLGEIIFRLKFPVQRIGGVVIVLLGLYVLFYSRLKFLPALNFSLRKKPAGIIGIIFVGVVFAFSFTACATPYLAAVLTVASIKADLFRGFLLLLFFSLGLSLPFLISALSLSWFLTLFGKIKKSLRVIEIAAGSMLILFGIYILSGKV